MKTTLILTACLLALPAFAEKPADVKPIVTGNTVFALDLYGKLRTQEGNLFLSPYSISTALAMTYGGARGNTEKQMAATLRFTVPQEQLHLGFAALQSRLNAVQRKGKIKLAVANSLWPQTGYEFLPGFVALCRDRYEAQPTAVDFAGATEAARKQINDWAAAKTEQKIKDLIPPGVLDTLTRLVLANAIYFKGDWQTKFDPQATKEEPFHVTPDKPVTVPLMNLTTEAGYAEFEDVQVLRLPYVGRDLSMLVALPKAKDGLATVEARLSRLQVEAWVGRTDEERKVRVTLPKFKLTGEFRVDSALKSLGMTDAFSLEKADFSGMDGRQHWLYVAAVLHKAFVEVNEEGTEAAAATAVVVKVKSAPAPIPVFRADHPFLFLIRENQTGSILFLGRLMDPTK